MLEELLQTILVHLNAAHVLLLLHIDVRNVQPDIAKVRGRLSNLSENIPSLVDAALVRQHRPDAVRRPNVLRIVAQHLLENGQRLLLVLLLLVLVLAGLVQRLQPKVAQRNQRIGIRRGGRILEDRLEVLLTQNPLHLGQMEVAEQRPGVRIFGVDLEGVLEEIGRHKDETLVAGHTAQPQVAVDVVRMLLEDVLVEFVGPIEAAHGLVETRQIVGHRDGDRIVVLDVVLSFGLGPF